MAIVGAVRIGAFARYNGLPGLEDETLGDGFAAQCGLAAGARETVIALPICLTPAAL